MATVFERFVTKIRLDDDCWIWTASLNPGGYASFTAHHGHNVRAHRWAYENIGGGSIGDGIIDHLCRNRACVKPAHMEVVDYKTNLLRGDTFNAKNLLKTHCPRGHAYSGANLWIYHSRNGPKRFCRACNRIHSSAARAKRKAAHE